MENCRRIRLISRRIDDLTDPIHSPISKDNALDDELRRLKVSKK